MRDDGDASNGLVFSLWHTNTIARGHFNHGHGALLPGLGAAAVAAEALAGTECDDNSDDNDDYCGDGEHAEQSVLILHHALMFGTVWHRLAYTRHYSRLYILAADRTRKIVHSVHIMCIVGTGSVKLFFFYVMEESFRYIWHIQHIMIQRVQNLETNINTVSTRKMQTFFPLSANCQCSSCVCPQPR